MNRPLRPFLVFAFESTHEAMNAEDALRAAFVQVVPIPTPTTLGGLCGLAMRVPPEESDRAREVLAGAGIPPRAETVIDDF